MTCCGCSCSWCCCCCCCIVCAGSRVFCFMCCCCTNIVGHCFCCCCCSSPWYGVMRYRTPCLLRQCTVYVWRCWEAVSSFFLCYSTMPPRCIRVYPSIYGVYSFHTCVHFFSFLLLLLFFFVPVMPRGWTRHSGSVTNWTSDTAWMIKWPSPLWSMCWGSWEWRVRKCRSSGTTESEYCSLFVFLKGQEELEFENS